MKKIFFIILSTIIGSSHITLAQQTNNSEAAKVPQDWILSPEDQDENQKYIQVKPLGLWDDAKNLLLKKSIQKIFKSNQSAMKTLNNTPINPGPNGEVPWHLELFTTDLSVMASGAIGLLTTAQGQPSVQVYWRRQGEKPKASTKEVAEPLMQTEASPFSWELPQQITPEMIAREIEPMALAALATGKIKDAVSFRKNLLQAAQEFYYVTQGLQMNPGFEWWVSTFRMDFIVRASGALAAAPLLSVGGEVRLRFDWRHLENIHPTIKYHAPKTKFLSKNTEKLKTELYKFTAAMSNDLEKSLNTHSISNSTKAFSFRVALGLRADTTIGIAKAGATVLAHIVFARDVRPPIVYPIKNAKIRLDNNTDNDNLDSEPLYVIESHSPQNHIDYANAHNISMLVSNNNDKGQEVFYKVDRNAFRKGLMKAASIGGVFADIGSEIIDPRWKFYMMKLGFDLSITGTLGLYKLGGIASAEMIFFNMNF